ncbi:AAA family ATPase [Bradyrhizobium acaciae]|uniref:AAA family ATPase n=1 Tax=Bradyrhizobium acaciae TaxID=2683706 RepID=UPI001E33B07D|nr:AAA family ATPase [Bradyrhizobium acaciae]MCC8978678.1 AAA family ATPase [Bradyrhizobium acaciae]
MAAGEEALRIRLTQGAIDNGYIRVPSDQQLFPSRFIAVPDGEPEERFSLILPDGRVFRTCLLGKYSRLQLRFGATFKKHHVQPGDFAVLDRDPASSDRYVLTFERDPARPDTTSLPVTIADNVAMPDLNRIFYGPPGTGKTYATVTAALEILDPQFLSENQDDREALKSRFDQLVAAGDVRFVTFHQSFSYEDFVEGLRAENDENGQLRYEIVDGVFKNLCTAATARVTEQREAPVDLENRRVWKMSLGNWLGDDAYIFDECIENGYALLGYGGTTDFSDCKDREDVFDRFIASGESLTRDSYPVSAVNTFLFKVSEGDLLVVTEGNSKFRAIGQVIGDYRRVDRKEQNDSYGQCRPVKWLRVYKPSLPLEQLMNNQFSQMTLYELRPGAIDMSKLAALLNSRSEISTQIFKVGEQFGTGYEVVFASADLVELAKPNGNRLPIGIGLLKTLADHVKKGDLTLDDIREKRVFDKLSDSKLEPYLVNGYNNILPRLVERCLSGAAAVSASKSNAKVLIIDEINRGNVSRIFGELITLVEPSKRHGAPEALEVVLPYSKTRFSIPSNVFLIATMNTADRSLTGLDIALRRRFSFQEMVPQIEELEDIEVSGVEVSELLKVMNDRIEVLLDREHRLGHAYFLDLRSQPTIEVLSAIFRQKIIPLLQEYFFEDWTRIQLVLNDHRKSREHCFVVEVKDDLEALFGETNVPGQRVRWEINEEAFDLPAAYSGIIDHVRQPLSPETEFEGRKGHLTVKQLSTGTIQVWENGALLPEARPLLWKLATELGLKTHYSSGKEYNTRSLGAAVISALNASAS